jgi:hypothetical protein
MIIAIDSDAQRGGTRRSQQQYQHQGWSGAATLCGSASGRKKAANFHLALRLAAQQGVEGASSRLERSDIDGYKASGVEITVCAREASFGLWSLHVRARMLP